MRNTRAKSFTRLNARVTLIGGFLLCLVLCPPVAAQVSYTVTDVGKVNDLGGGAGGINNRGAVVGQEILPGGTDRPFLWIRGAVLDLGTFGGPGGGAHAINQRGQVVGEADTADDVEHAFLWDQGTLLDLLSFGGGHSESNGINSRGEVVGFAATTIPDPTQTTGDTESHAFLWAGGPMKDLGTLGGPNSIAIDINDSGLIVGWSQVDFNIGDFGIPDLHPATWENGVITRLPDLGGPISLAIGVNNRGVAVGQSFSPDFILHAVMWKNGAVKDLGILSGDSSSSASRINNKDQVVGTSSSDISSRAFVWQNGVMTDLNTLIPADSGWVLLGAGDINDMGQIVGIGVLNGDLHSFLLTPSSGGGKTGSTKASVAAPLSQGILRHLIWGRSGLLKRQSQVSSH
jgi:probable HAF family extracellular repeat protein